MVSSKEPIPWASPPFLPTTCAGLETQRRAHLPWNTGPLQPMNTSHLASLSWASSPHHVLGCFPWCTVRATLSFVYHAIEQCPPVLDPIMFYYNYVCVCVWDKGFCLSLELIFLYICDGDLSIFILLVLDSWWRFMDVGCIDGQWMGQQMKGWVTKIFSN